MRSIILETATRVLKPVLLVASILILLRGHDNPGGGFAGGLLAAGAFAMKKFAGGPSAARAALPVDLHILIGAGAGMVGVSALLPLLLGAPILTAQSIEIPLVPTAFTSTVLLFDAGVYCIVLGTVLVALLTFAEEEDGAVGEGE